MGYLYVAILLCGMFTIVGFFTEKNSVQPNNDVLRSVECCAFLFFTKKIYDECG